MKKLTLVLCVVLLVTMACASGITGSVHSISTQSSKGDFAMKLSILINDATTLIATLYDNSSTRALVALLQKGAVTIDMQDYGNFEKVGDLPVTLPRNDTPTNTDAGDIILYLGKRFVIYYDKNSWNFTPLGKVDGVSKSELKKILGTGNVTAVLSIAE